MDDPREKQRPDESDGPGDDGGSADTPPALPSDDDDTALGDTDQHSSADA